MTRSSRAMGERQPIHYTEALLGLYEEMLEQEGPNSVITKDAYELFRKRLQDGQLYSESGAKREDY